MSATQPFIFLQSTVFCNGIYKRIILVALPTPTHIHTCSNVLQSTRLSAMSRFGRGSLCHQSSENELNGKLQKRNRNGIFQARYFQTQGSVLKYWSNEQDKNTTNCSVFDVREFRSVQNVGDNCLSIQMTNDKFKLDLKAISNEQCNEWVDFLKAKMSLYSVDHLKSSIDSEAVAFKTRTFAGLLRVPVHDQDQWINDTMNDVFLSVTDCDEIDDNGEKIDPSRQTLQACQKCYEEFSLICEECEVEMSHRDPVVMSNCRDFMHRYAALFMSRITLELSWYLGKEKCGSNHMSDLFVIESIKFTHSIDRIKHYQFLPRSLFIGLRENLQTFDQLSKYLANILLDRNDAWFTELNELQPRQRGHKLREFYKIVNFQVEKIHTSFVLNDKEDADTKRNIIMNTINTMVFSLAKYVKNLDFSNYGEEALLEHILACQEIVKFCCGLKVYPYDGKINSHSTIENFGLDLNLLTKQWTIALRDHELEVLSSTFLTSADTAAASAVKNTFQTFEDIRKMFFFEKTGMGWMGGKVCQLYLDRVTTWMVAFCQRASATPCAFHRIAIRETIRMVVFSYINGLCERYRNDKKFMLSEDGSHQLAADLQSIMSWVDTQNVKLIPPTIKNRSEYKGCNDLTMLLRNIRMFVTSDESSLLFCVSEAIQHFGTAAALHIYDLARLCLKIRDDVSNNSRKHHLGLCATYVEQLQRASLEEFGPLSKSHPRLSGPKLLAELFPRVGVYHCSGKKWRMEKLPESETDARLEIANLVTDACNISRIRRAGVTREIADRRSSRKQSSFRGKRMSCGMDSLAADLSAADLSVASSDDTESSDLWHFLLDPSHVDADSCYSDQEGSVGDDCDSDVDGNDCGDDCGGESPPEISKAKKTDSGRNYELADERPFVDLHGCSFEDLHLSLRPRLYSMKEFDPIVFTRSNLRPSLTRSSIVVLEGTEDSDGESDNASDSGSGDDGAAMRLSSDGNTIESPDGNNAHVHRTSDIANGTITSDESSVNDNTPSLENENAIKNCEIISSVECSDNHGTIPAAETSEKLVVPPPPKPPKPRRYSHVESDTD